MNIGPEEMISINDLAELVIGISRKKIAIDTVEGPTGVRGRNSDNTLIRERPHWAPSQPLKTGIERT